MGNGKNDQFNKYISIVLVIVIVCVTGIYTYTQLVEKDPTDHNNYQPTGDSENTILNVTMGSDITSYTLDELKSIGVVSGNGAYVNKIGKVTGPNDYTGIPITSLLDSIDNIPDNYTVQATASDDYSVEYSYSEVNGEVKIYNETGVEIGTSMITMIIAYKENGNLIDEDNGGPLRIAFIDEEGSITGSGKWLQSLVNLEVIES
ncbi:MAG: molybdopterin-dependent oxidoreductase [Candidatus Lokiarchaeota archaeon]|nr:molybdopterin-dependent oxidoreductase [Candidatus Lokiarchaeota archaeon]